MPPSPRKEETAASLEELTATVTRNRDSAHQAASLATQSSDVTIRGREVVGQLFSTMNEISGSSTRIGEIVGIIDGIAFQTNLLALNAAVEAARAGDQGRGFAVVAQEVRSLAQRSAAAAKEVKDLIEASVQTVGRGTDLANQAEQAMSKVVDSVQQVTNVIREIETATLEQAAGIEQINKAVAEMDNITQQDAHMAQQLIETAQTLREQSTQMFAAISAFSLHRGQPPSAARSAEARTHFVDEERVRRVA
ncbi:methyl-accepting chemotaxis protein [Steroidobacter cummioxidans]|uniref:methyl-accepting chemotaxis protein n=1 Tax=Steroidobacter cummioxidans TaxID=1803913 RepID=UPI000E32146E|nr:methyl-accepting chemotaxis protein [Steroidobacter cummioxidans]